MVCCIWYFKDIYLKAIHNTIFCKYNIFFAVFDISKIFIWKQFTTISPKATQHQKLYLIFQRYLFESNSQPSSLPFSQRGAVFDISKIFIWKQFTTQWAKEASCWSCIWYFKDIYLKAIHNGTRTAHLKLLAVFDISKIFIWKQFTTVEDYVREDESCIWYFKDIYLKAIHNRSFRHFKTLWLYLIFQRYLFESNSQLVSVSY